MRPAVSRLKISFCFKRPFCDRCSHNLAKRYVQCQGRIGVECVGAGEGEPEADSLQGPDVRLGSREKGIQLLRGLEAVPGCREHLTDITDLGLGWALPISGLLS